MSGSLLNCCMDHLTEKQQRVVIEGQISTWSAILYGVPQGSLLGPLFFMIFIIDLVDFVMPGNTMPLYYDDYKTSNAINSHLDQNEFQSDLDNLYTWSPQNLMEFDVKMCKLMRITKKRMPHLSDTKLNNNILEETSESCDFSQATRNKLSWNVHVNTIANKAKKILSLARTCMIMILSYIYSRRQFAQVNDKTSELIDTKLGVAQGSTLGHVLCSMAKLFAFAEM